MGRQLAERLATRLGAPRARAGLLTLAVIAAAAVGLSVGLSSGSARGGYVDPAAAPVVVKVDPSAVQRRIPNGFLGLSIEYWALENYAGKNPRAVNPVLAQLIRHVVPKNSGLLRIGGVTTDKTWWPVSGVTQSKGINYTLTKGRLQVAGALAHATGSHLIMGVQFEADSTKIARAEAQAMLRYIGRSRLAAFELGNEPELFGNPNFGWYTVNGKPVPGRPPPYDLGEFTRDFAKIGAALPAPPPLAGPSSSVGSWVSDLGTFIHGAPRLGLVTLHRYPFQACFATPSSPVYPTIARLLSPAGSTVQASGIAPYVSTVHNAHLRLSVDEMNSVSCGSPGRVTNSFAEALWVVDALFADAAVGVDNVDVHTWPGAVYQLFTMSHRGSGWRASVYPEYYGLLLFSQAAPPGSSLVQSSTDNAKVRAWATRGSDGVIRVALINDDTGAAHQLSVRIPGSHGRASLALLRAPSVFSTRGVTLANQSFGSATRTGVLGGARRTSAISPKQGAYSVRLPAASAALLTLR
jgi:hypothetical protein